MAPSRHDSKIVDWDVKPQHNQPTGVRKFGSEKVWGRKGLRLKRLIPLGLKGLGAETSDILPMVRRLSVVCPSSVVCRRRPHFQT